MNPGRPILLAVLCATAALPALAGMRHYPITPEQIASAIADDGIRVSGNEIALLADVVATVPQPALRLSSIHPAANHLLIARVECADAAQCLPFLVSLHVDGVTASPAAKEAAPQPQPHRPVAPVVHAGSKAILLLDGPHVHIRLTVICLENGVLGQTVRAANPDRSQYYFVQVAGDQLLRGRL